MFSGQSSWEEVEGRYSEALFQRYNLGEGSVAGRRVWNVAALLGCLLLRLGDPTRSHVPSPAWTLCVRDQCTLSLLVPLSGCCRTP